MRTRCTNPNYASYHRYGGRGITICDKWDDFDVFVKDMGLKPAGLSLDRRNNDKGYSKSNCYWATQQQQAENKSTMQVLTIDGDSKPIAQWAQQTGVRVKTIRSRLLYGWTVKRAVFAPVIKHPNYLQKQKSKAYG